MKATLLGTFVDAALELVSPTRCAGCELPGELFCTACAQKLESIDQRWSCKRCGAPFGYITCTECHEQEMSISQVYSLGEFTPPLSRSIVLFKDHHEKRLDRALGEALAQGYMKSELAGRSFDIATWIPAADKAIRRRGFDHAQLLAMHFMRICYRASPTMLLTRTRAQHRGQLRDQRSLDREARAQNVAGTFALVCPPKMIMDKTILLIDDVFTTGATLGEAAKVFMESGAKEVCATTLARVY